MDNTARGVLAEFLVFTALRQHIRVQPHVEWDSYDLRPQFHGRDVSIEVKSSSKVLPRQESVGRQGRLSGFVAWGIGGHRLRGRSCPVPEVAHEAMSDLELRPMKNSVALSTAACT